MRLVDEVRAELVRTGEPATPAAVAAAVRRHGMVLGADDLVRTTEQVHADLLGAGPLQALLEDEAVTDVVVNGPADVWVDRGDGLVRAPVRFADDAAVRVLAQRLAAAAGRRLDEGRPWVDARLASGVRLHAVLPPIAVPGTLLSLRVPARRPFDLATLVASGSIPAWSVPWLRALVAARLSFLVTGGTGTGKTTILAALLSMVDAGDRVLLVEDSGELAPDHPHVVRLQARPPNVEGSGEVALADLVRQALRMRPDRLVVGEVRGPEVVDLLAALNTGHDGGCGTLHANAPAQVPARLEALAQAAGMARDAVHSQVAAGLQAVVHLSRDRTGRRCIDEIGVVRRSGLHAEVHTALRLVPATGEASTAAAPDPPADVATAPAAPVLLHHAPAWARGPACSALVDLLAPAR